MIVHEKKAVSPSLHISRSSEPFKVLNPLEADDIRGIALRTGLDDGVVRECVCRKGGIDRLDREDDEGRRGVAGDIDGLDSRVVLDGMKPVCSG